MFTRERPARLSSSAIFGSSTPFVVIDTFSMPGVRAISRTRSATPLRTSGSPPVRRTLLTPRPAATRTTRAISSMRRMSSCESWQTPSSGMQ